MFMCVYMCTYQRPTKPCRAPPHIALVALLLNLAWSRTETFQIPLFFEV